MDHKRPPVRQSQEGLEVSAYTNALHVAPTPQPDLEVRQLQAGYMPHPHPHHDRTMGSGFGQVRSSYDQNEHSRKAYSIPIHTFWIALVALVLVVIAIAVGLGVGLSQRSTPSALSAGGHSPTLPNPTAVNPTAVSTAQSGGCTNGTIYKTTNNSPFAEVCNTDFTTGSSPSKTFAADMPPVANMATFEDCMDACAIYKSAGVSYNQTGGTCFSVTWVSQAVTGYGTCFMKNNTALIGSSNQTAIAEHAVPTAHLGFHSANFVGK
ncbi:MAG: hypothetical protein M1828_005716 [Chrysothrix sp. TS-e1954]|nr:MAG: hypothetical protein M1828_005716 [Chrysothrix sp. TS-e1954]